MDYNLPTWMYAADLVGAVSFANDDTTTSLVREIFAQRAADLMDNWLIDDEQCKRVVK